MLYAILISFCIHVILLFPNMEKPILVEKKPHIITVTIQKKKPGRLSQQAMLDKQQKNFDERILICNIPL